MKHNISRNLSTLAVLAALGLSFLTAGCARTLSRTEETRVSGSGTVTTKEKTVTQNPDGTINQTESRKTSRP
jgi:predicted phage tail protein